MAKIVDALGDEAPAAMLDLLHALTEADATAAGPAAWSSWKANQVGYLVDRVRSALAGEPVAEVGELSVTELDLIATGGLGTVIRPGRDRARRSPWRRLTGPACWPQQPAC